MGGAHSHSHSHDLPDVEVGFVSRFFLLTSLALVALATIIGLFVLWPGDGEKPTPPQYAADGTTFPVGKVVSVSEPCPVIVADPNAPPGSGEDFPEHCNELTAQVGKDRVVIQVPPYVAKSGLQNGDEVKLARIAGADGAEPSWGWVGTQRNAPLGLLLVAFVLVTLVVARLRGLMALIGLVFAGSVVAARKTSGRGQGLEVG